MYVPDTLERLNDQAIAKYMASLKTGEEECECCYSPATHIIPVYNPRDKVEGREGAYAVYVLCDECEKAGYHLQENFHCPGCGELFIMNHSWDFVAVKLDDGLYCQACATERIQPRQLWVILRELRTGTAFKKWRRINNIPGMELVWRGEYAPYSDFPGLQSLEAVANSIEELDLHPHEEVIPAVIHGYQFSVVLGLFK